MNRVGVTCSQDLFRLGLLPLWIATYGEVVGERPWSVPRIAAAVVAAPAVVGVVVVPVIAGRRGGQGAPADSGRTGSIR